MEVGYGVRVIDELQGNLTPIGLSLPEEVATLALIVVQLKLPAVGLLPLGGIRREDIDRHPINSHTSRRVCLLPRIAQRRVLGYEIVIQQDSSTRIVAQGAIGVVRLEVDDLHGLCPLSHHVRAGADLFPLVFLPLAHVPIDLSRLRLLEVDTQVFDGVGRG